ncbi:hypothetical protein SAY86_007001 [Trapa natans]|uniref:Trichome birefringence-like N-terminal domain-containing protein n=1 Tax=Trapa natans TaxID=22666 RepID=A0AAN7QXG2_TRANT|nr:hypothetical protein SAY86_007001 [Trapa natans]
MKRSKTFAAVEGRERKGGEGGARANFHTPTVVILIFLLGFFIYEEERAVKFRARSFFSSSSSLPECGPDKNCLKLSLLVTPERTDNLAPLETPQPTEQEPQSRIAHHEEDVKTENRPPAVEECDIFNGEWVLDNLTRPLYEENECNLLSTQVTCLRNGRKDSLYQKWRWQPRDCSLPKFEAKLLLEKLRNKRLLYAGDSLNRNQWESMLCLVQSAVSPDRRSMKLSGSSLAIFHFTDYNATIEYYWAPFLVESNVDDPSNHSLLNRILMPESIVKHAQHWKGAHFLIFNTYTWWLNSKNTRVLRGSFDEGSMEYDEIERAAAYERVLRTWANWIDENVDPNQTAVFFNSMSPVHSRQEAAIVMSNDWNNPSGIKCYKETTPIMNVSAPLDVGTNRSMFVIAQSIASRMRVPVHFMNITTLSEYRKDAHTSLFSARRGKRLTQKEMANPAVYADCTHWCLPGLPDTWNELLYARIMSLR